MASVMVQKYQVTDRDRSVTCRTPVMREVGNGNVIGTEDEV